MIRKHANATTDAAMRQDIQTSTESLRVLARKYGINVKTVVKWRKRSSLEDARRPPRMPTRKLNEVERAMAITFRRCTLLPLDDCQYAMQSLVPSITRTALYRCLKEFGLNRLPQAVLRDENPLSQHMTPKVGHFRLDIVFVPTDDGPYHNYIATDVAARFTSNRLYPATGQLRFGEFLEALSDFMPYPIVSVMTEDLHKKAEAISGMSAKENEGAIQRFMDMCADRSISYHPYYLGREWPGFRTELADMALKRAALETGYYAGVDTVKDHSIRFFLDFNFNRKLKQLEGATPFQAIAAAYRATPEIFKMAPDEYAVWVKEHIAEMVG